MSLEKVCKAIYALPSFTAIEFCSLIEQKIAEKTSPCQYLVFPVGKHQESRWAFFTRKKKLTKKKTVLKIGKYPTLQLTIKHLSK